MTPSGSRNAARRVAMAMRRALARHRGRLGVTWSVVRVLLSLLVIILAIGLVIVALVVMGTYVVHLFGPESWHWLTDRQLARLPLL